MNQCRWAVRAMIAAAVAALLAGCAGGLSGQSGEGGARAGAKPLPPGKAAFVPKDLLGRTGPELDQAMGPAALVRTEGQGEFRRYSMARCVLLVILYPDDKGAHLVRHLDAAALRSDAAAPSLEACLAGGR